MAKTVRLISPDGVAVTVDAGKVKRMQALGFTVPEPAPRRTRKK